MNRTLLGVFGFILLLVAIALPFLGLGQSKGDVLPLFISLLVFLVSGGFLVLAIKPEIFRKYVIGAAALVGSLVVVFIILLVA